MRSSTVIMTFPFVKGHHTLVHFSWKKILSWSKMDRMQQVYICQNKLALKEAEFCWQGLVLSIRLVNKHLVAKLIFHFNKTFTVQATAYNKWMVKPGNTKGGSITVPLTSCSTVLESAVWQQTIFVFICKANLSKPVKQEVNSTVILPPSVFHGQANSGRKLRA